MNHWLNEGKQILSKPQVDEQEIDEINGIERKPTLGCMIIVIGTIIFWSMVYWLYNLIIS
jgi:hypothetical protein